VKDTDRKRRNPIALGEDVTQQGKIVSTFRFQTPSTIKPHKMADIKGTKKGLRVKDLIFGLSLK
jgi:hypothetical protein